MEPTELGHKTIRSIVALTSRTVFLQAISLVAFFLLGIFLSPQAIGVFIAVSALMRIFGLFTDLGLGAALVQKHGDLDDSDLKTTFTLQEALVVAVVGIGFLLTPKISYFARLDADGTFLYQVLLITLFLSSLKAIPSILLERRLAFERQVIPQIAEALVFNFLVVVLAYRGLGVAAYSWSILVSSLVGLPIYYLVSPWRVGIGVSVDRIKHLLSYGLAYQAKNFLSVFKDDLLTVFLNNLVGPAGIGYWGWAQRWSYSPFRLLVDSVTKVTFPAYSRVQHNRELLRVGIEKSLFAVSATLFPVLTLMAILVSRLIYLLPKYAKWEPALISFYFLAAGAAVSGLSNILVNALDATGRVKTTLGLMIIWIVTTWVLTLTLVVRFGFTGISVASFLVTLTVVLTVYLVKRVVEFDFLGFIWPAAMSSVAMGVTMIYISRLLANSYLALVVIGVSGAILYVALMCLFAKEKIITDLRIVLRAYRHQ